MTQGKHSSIEEKQMALKEKELALEEKMWALEEKHKAFEEQQKALEEAENLRSTNLEMQRKLSQLEADLQVMIHLIPNFFLLVFLKLTFFFL